MSIRLCALAELASGTARRFDVEGHKMAVVRLGDDVYAIDDTCSHADVSLSEGEVLESERELECWKHGSAFSLVDGQPSCLPAVRPVAVYDVSVIDDDVVVRFDGEARDS